MARIKYIPNRKKHLHVNHAKNRKENQRGMILIGKKGKTGTDSEPAKDERLKSSNVTTYRKNEYEDKTKIAQGPNAKPKKNTKTKETKPTPDKERQRQTLKRTKSDRRRNLYYVNRLTGLKGSTSEVDLCVNHPSGRVEFCTPAIRLRLSKTRCCASRRMLLPRSAL